MYHFPEKEVHKYSVFDEKIAWKHPHFVDKRNDVKRSVWPIKFDVMRGKRADRIIDKINPSLLNPFFWIENISIIKITWGGETWKRNK